MSAMWRTAAVRWGVFLAFWLSLIGLSLSATAVGIVAAAAATWASLALLPPGRQRVRLLPMLALLPRFFWQSLLAGWDVARRAFAPQIPLRPGFVAYRCAHRPGHFRNTFATISSLLPGTLPCGEDEDHLVFHCLDVDQPVYDQLALEERVLAPLFAESANDV
ncbi:MAG: Na+/H+ antiporter subunit E [Dechloromonas sp.]|mgnify:FL=1|nr:Na+/H+ antiporter subunit E [Dechloromonas sp.]